MKKWRKIIAGLLSLCAIGISGCKNNKSESENFVNRTKLDDYYTAITIDDKHEFGIYRREDNSYIKSWSGKDYYLQIYCAPPDIEGKDRIYVCRRNESVSIRSYNYDNYKYVIELIETKPSKPLVPTEGVIAICLVGGLCVTILGIVIPYVICTNKRKERERREKNQQQHLQYLTTIIQKEVYFSYITNNGNTLKDDLLDDWYEKTLTEQYGEKIASKSINLAHSNYNGSCHAAFVLCEIYKQREEEREIARQEKERKKQQKRQEKIEKSTEQEVQRDWLDYFPTRTVDQFFVYRKQNMHNDFTGVYILWNNTKGKPYVGQAKNILSRVNNHFTGHGNGDVYADYKYGDRFLIKLVPLKDSGYASLNKLEADLIARFRANTCGYNKTKGNK